MKTLTKEKKYFKKHGMWKSRFYHTYYNIKTRCENKNTPGYARYGGRGIRCEWDTFEKFKEEMYADYIEKSARGRITIDRIDNDGNYCKKNCRWTTDKEQSRNKTNNILIEFDGQLLCATDVATKHNISTQRLVRRLRSGWTLEDAISRPVSLKGFAIRQYHRPKKDLILS